MIVRAALTEKYTALPNDLLQDPNLSFDAVTVMARLLSLPPDWKVCLQNLRRRWGCGLERLKKVMRELIAAGWVQRIPSRKLPNGSYSGGDYLIFNVRQAVEQTLPLDATAGDVDQPEDRSGACASSAESAEPESVRRTPNKDSNPTNNPPYPPIGGARSSDDRILEREALAGRRPDRSTERRPRTDRGCRGSAPPAVVLEPAALGRFERLWSAYPMSGRLTADRSEALAIFAALTPADQETAIRTAVSYAASCSEKRAQAKALHRWLRIGRWANGELPFSRPTAATPGGPPGRVFVREGTPEWNAWEGHHRRFGKLMPTPTWSRLNRAEGWNFPSALPPAHDEAA